MGDKGEKLQCEDTGCDELNRIERARREDNVEGGAVRHRVRKQQRHMSDEAQRRAAYSITLSNLQKALAWEQGCREGQHVTACTKTRRQRGGEAAATPPLLKRSMKSPFKREDTRCSIDAKSRRLRREQI